MVREIKGGKPGPAMHYLVAVVALATVSIIATKCMLADGLNPKIVFVMSSVLFAIGLSVLSRFKG